ncbi:hypothetical protein ABID65_006671 [Bradyrhizobium sp. S3.9.2]|uniref:hypothetical protein n=1 Tax=Bradyrhizobium sp. S3.9.2 TaxID=3156432 RepID=UPI0033979B72
MRTLTTTEEVVAVLGGLESVCALTGALPKAVYHWTGRAEMFPARTYWVMQEALKRRKAKAPPSLWNMIKTEKRTA